MDVGLKDFAVLSTGEKIPHPRHMERRERRLKQCQRRLARCQRGSQNRARARVKVARQHARVTEARRDFLHKASTDLVRRFGVIAAEDLIPLLRAHGWPFASTMPGDTPAPGTQRAYTGPTLTAERTARSYGHCAGHPGQRLPPLAWVGAVLPVPLTAS